MSAEAFQTVLSCDARTGADGRSVEYAPSGTGQPRWLNDDGTIRREEGVRGWADCYLYAHNVVNIAAQAVRDEVMNGETGDHPERRDQVAAILDAAAALVRELALDAAHDSALTDERWEAALARVSALADSATSVGARRHSELDGACPQCGDRADFHYPEAGRWLCRYCPCDHDFGSTEGTSHVHPLR